MKRLNVVNLRFLDKGPFNLSVSASQCAGISGPSGVGKTLLLRAVADMDPHHGEVWLDGAECRSIKGPVWRRNVGLLAAESRWWEARVRDHFPVVDQEAFGALGLDVQTLDWRVSRLSSGERQRLALLRLLTNRPPVLLLDEPTANLDPKNAERVEQLVARYREDTGAAVIWVGHDVEQLSRVASIRYDFQSPGCLTMEPPPS